ncbi:hypothetical protein BpHYR1_008578 [Brachionus plicatilis]|uniref:Transmembrane protein n=1 Tax=Brachionus plicatilis TaxID=10195 RepID=A0A3M7QWE1_BRAPC|nr:hypothetical protein BpHYR1_008578 [Brachionus plicatilis]
MPISLPASSKRLILIKSSAIHDFYFLNLFFNSKSYFDFSLTICYFCLSLYQLHIKQKITQLFSYFNCLITKKLKKKSTCQIYTVSFISINYFLIQFLSFYLHIIISDKKEKSQNIDISFNPKIQKHTQNKNTLFYKNLLNRVNEFGKTL